MLLHDHCRFALHLKNVNKLGPPLRTSASVGMMGIESLGSICP